MAALGGGGFDFLRQAEARKCHSRKARYMLLKYAERKDDKQQDEIPAPENALVTRDVLKHVLSAGKLEAIIRCNCPICLLVSRKTPEEDDKILANDIANDSGRQRLFATLAFMGGTFATRLLDKHDLNTVEETLMPDRAELLRSLFVPFQSSWDTAHCSHRPERHTRNESLLCLQEYFLAQLRTAAWIVRIPDFQANNLLKHFGEKVNTPFIKEQYLAISNRGGGREFFSFVVHPAYCDDKLQVRAAEVWWETGEMAGQLQGESRQDARTCANIQQGRRLFRKQLSIDTPEKVARSKQESDILKFLKDLSNPNIAEVLFAFQEEQPPRLSLVFECHPTDLQKILFPKLDPYSTFQAPEKTTESFPGSVLDHWMWIGVLGVFDAVAAIHDPQVHTSSLPRNAKFETIGGHFDIKPANILINVHGQFLLTDFGQAFFKTIKRGQESNFSIYPGTWDYKPPLKYSTPKNKTTNDPSQGKWWSREYDVWSLACISVEVLAFIVNGPDAPSTFYEDRKKEEDGGPGTFWKTTRLGEVLKESVRRRLMGFRAHQDDYLTRVAEQVEKMFRIERSEPVTVKACQRELSASVKVDRYVFKGQTDQLIAGDDTYACLSTMRTSFSTDRVSPLRCWLYLWRNPKRNRFTLTLEFAGSDNQTIVTPCSTRAQFDAIIPLTLFDPDKIYDQNRFRSNHLPLQCAFRNMYDGTIFHFARRDYYHHFLGAFTHQYIATKSEFRFKSCVLESASKLSSKTWSSTNGHFQVWMTLTPRQYDGRYRDPVRAGVPSINLPQSPRPEDSSSNSSSSFRQRISRDFTPANPHFRLALYLCGKPTQALAIVSLTYDTYDMTFDKTRKEGLPRMVLERKSRQNDIIAAVIEGPETGPASDSQEGFGPSNLVDECPGIPMSEQVLSDLIRNGKGLRRVEVEFWNEADQDNFRKYYREKFP